MAKRREGKEHRFGGDWTKAKLDVLAHYLSAYTTALEHKPTRARPFRKVYIDAFAGTGYRTSRREASDSSGGQLPFPDLAEAEPQALLDGSARLALKTQPRFDYYIFIEKSPPRCRELEVLKSEFPDLADDIEIHQGDANAKIQDMCRRDWSSTRAVLFLDPYGMQVQWETIAAVAGTEAVDTWILFPIGIGVNRLLTKSGEIFEGWSARITELLGTREWYDEFYVTKRTETLWGAEEEVVKRASIETIGRYFIMRLRSVFCGVSNHPRVLCNSSNSPLYLLCFAAGNKRGARIALRIADHLLKKGLD